MRNRFAVIAGPLIAAVTLAVVIAGVPASPAFAQTEVPLLVNVQPGVSLSDDEIAAMVAEANKILKQADIKIKFNKATDINRGVDDQGNNNDRIETGEDDKLDPKGVTELNEHTGDDDQGFKIYITNEIHGSPTTLGLAAHNPDVPVIYLKSGQSAEKGGNTIAHEFSHVYTLGPNHVVSGTTTADGKGHIAVPGNLMHPTSDGTELTDEQKAELKKGVKGHGHTVDWFDRRWREIKDTFGYNIATPPSQLFSGGVWEQPSTATFEVDVGFSGRMGPAGNQAIQIVFDTDGNPLTGRSVLRPNGSTVTGIDRTIDIRITGDMEAGGTLVARLLDGNGNLMRLLNDAQFERIARFEDARPGPGITSAACDWVRLAVQTAELGITDICPTEFLSFNLNDPDMGDTLQLEVNPFDPQADPVLNLLQLEALPGGMVNVMGTGFFAGALGGLIQFDDTAVGGFNTDPLGNFGGMFHVPSDAAPGWYFITASAMDSTSLETQYDFKMLKVLPEPATLSLLALGGLATLLRRRRK
ncbi:MAG: PEP-CTERM sorting domain-containing protein [Planctomycetota bacterium]|nr:PEP-CTERM sorting domain-containing protein [Planctomycetota bacterium]